MSLNFTRSHLPAPAVVSSEGPSASSWWVAFCHPLPCPSASFSGAQARPAQFWSCLWELSGEDEAESSGAEVSPPRPSCTGAPCPWWTVKSCPVHQKRPCLHPETAGGKGWKGWGYIGVTINNKKWIKRTVDLQGAKKTGEVKWGIEK